MCVFFVCVRAYYLGFSCEGRYVADLLGSQCVDDGALAHVGVANEAHTDLLLIRVQLTGQRNTSVSTHTPLLSQRNK